MKPIIESGIRDSLIKIIEEIDKRQKLQFAYLFGSFARGEQSKDSDLDIALMFNTTLTDLEDALLRGEFIELGRTIFQKEVDIVSLHKASIFLKYQIVNEGIVIKEGENRVSFESQTLREYFDFKYFSDIYDEAMISKIKNSGVR